MTKRLGSNNYDPRAHGADCDNCPLRGKTVVPPDIGSRASIAVVGEAPGEQEEKYGKPFVGPSGNEFNRACRMGGLKRGDLHITNALLCRPPDNDLKKVMMKVAKHNKQEAKAAQEEGREAQLQKTPLQCCHPRLKNELRGFSDFITLGKVGTTAVTKSYGSILSLRGGLIELNESVLHPELALTSPSGEALPQKLMRIMPTLHPAFVLRQQRWSHVFRNDVAKAARWFRGVAAWHPPQVTYNPTPSELHSFLTRPGTVYTFDIETDGIESLDCHIRCIAIGTEQEVMVVGMRNNRQPKDLDGLFLDFYGSREAAQISEILCRFFTDPDVPKVGHNAGYFDRLVLQNQMGIDPQPVYDTMLLHRNVESELPHTLAYVASIYTEAPSWKTDREGNKLALGGESDHQLHEYCANDVAITARVFAPLAEQVKLRDQTSVWKMDQRMQQICADMHTVGMYVDQEKRLAEEKKLLHTRHQLLTDIRDRLGMSSFNPGSVYQMRDVLFGKWGLESHIDATDLKEKDTITGSGDRSTGDLILRTLLTLKTVPKKQREIIKLIRRYRKCLKVLGTYVVKLRPWDMGADLGWDDDDDWIDQETRKKYGEVKRGIVNPLTGRMHPGYNAHVAVTGRLSSSKPINAQNFPGAQRGIVVPQPGHVLVGADMDQLELRIAAALWGVELYLRAFAEGKDPHSMTAFAVFGEQFCKAAGLTRESFSRPGKLVGACYDETGVFLKGVSKDAKSMRDLSKAVQYASQYMATVETVHKLIQKTELPSVDPATGKPRGDGTTDLPYAKLPLSGRCGRTGSMVLGSLSMGGSVRLMSIATRATCGNLWGDAEGISLTVRSRTRSSTSRFRALPLR
jgi:DNA polymerase I-like protein with 3'-5' exonuclease and polymerase domains/uracil-DNA glycosylase